MEITVSTHINESREETHINNKQDLWWTSSQHLTLPKNKRLVSLCKELNDHQTDSMKALHPIIIVGGSGHETTDHCITCQHTLRRSRQGSYFILGLLFPYWKLCPCQVVHQPVPAEQNILACSFIFTHLITFFHLKADLNSSGRWTGHTLFCHTSLFRGCRIVIIIQVITGDMGAQWYWKA